MCQTTFRAPLKMAAGSELGTRLSRSLPLSTVSAIFIALTIRVWRKRIVNRIEDPAGHQDRRSWLGSHQYIIWSCSSQASLKEKSGISWQSVFQEMSRKCFEEISWTFPIHNRAKQESEWSGIQHFHFTLNADLVRNLKNRARHKVNSKHRMRLHLQIYVTRFEAG